MNDPTNMGNENPYASPQLDGPKSAGEIRQGSPFATQSMNESFGLDEPLHAEGTLSDRDVEEAIKGITVPNRRRKLTVFLWIFISLYFVTYLLTHSISIFSLCLMSITFWFIGIFVFGFLCRRLRKTNLRKDLVRSQRHRRFEISESTIQVTSDGSWSDLRWESFSGYHHSERMMLFWLDSIHDWMIVTRALFSCDKDWETFVGLVRHKLLPLESINPMMAVAEVPGELPPIRMDASETDGSGRILRTTGGPTLKDMRQAVRFASVNQRYTRIGFWSLIILGVIPGVFFCFSTGRLAWAPLLTSVPALGSTVLLFVILPRRALRNQRDARQGFFRNVRYTFTDESIRVDTSTMTGISSWSEYPRVTRTRTLVLLRLPNETRCHLISRSCFDEESDWQAFLQRVDSKYPTSGNREG